MTAISLPDNPRILVIALRRLGDVLLATPLIRSLKRSFPAASIEALVFASSAGVLSGNPDLAGVIAVPERPSPAENVSLLLRLAKRYDLAVSTQTGDRPTTLAWIAGRRSVGPVEARGMPAAIKRAALHRCYVTNHSQHRVHDMLRLAELLGISVCPEIVCPSGPVRSEIMPAAPYAVVHAAPKFIYKRWTNDGWRMVAAALRERGLAIAVTGASQDRAYLDEVWRGCEVVRLDGALEWPEISALLGAARIYVGPDTAITHLAAAAGVQTVALYGPTDPRIWGPWPRRGLEKPWAAAGTIQQRGNVWLIQNPLPCLPCQQEGCDRRLDSHSRCLDELPINQVISAVDQALAGRQAA